MEISIEMRWMDKRATVSRSVKYVKKTKKRQHPKIYDIEILRLFKEMQWKWGGYYL